MRHVVLASLLLVACRQVAGIQTITYSGGDGGGGGCTNATAIITSNQTLDALVVAGGYAMAGVTSSTSFAYNNLLACPVGTPCTQPPGLLSLSFSDTLNAYGASSLIYYAIQTNSGAGSIHSVSFDGKTDQVVLASASYPLYLTASGSHVFWISDDESGANASVHCIGCGGPSDQTWINNLGFTYGVFADANNVYVVTDDTSANGTQGIYSCSVTAACTGAPKKVIEGIMISAIYVNSQATSDGTYVYITNDASAVVRIDAAGAQTDVVKSVAASAIAVDPATGELFYATDNGDVARVKSDGTGTPTPLATCDPQSPNAIIGIAYDATNVYVLSSPSTASTVYAIKR